VKVEIYGSDGTVPDYRKFEGVTQIEFHPYAAVGWFGTGLLVLLRGDERIPLDLKTSDVFKVYPEKS